MRRILPLLLLLLTGCDWSRVVPGLPMKRQQFATPATPQNTTYVRTLAVLPVRCPTNGLYRLEYSSDLKAWSPIARNLCGTGTNEMVIPSGCNVGFARLVKQKGFE